METKQRRKPITLSIAEDVITAAKSLHLNASQAAENGIKAAIRTSRQEAWLRDNKAAIEAYNHDVESNGLPFPPLWRAR